MTKIQQANALAVSQKEAAVTSVNRSMMEEAPTQENLAILRTMAEEGLLTPSLVTEAVLIYFSLDPSAIQHLKLRHLVDAAKRVEAGQVLGEDFYLIPKLGVYTSQVGVQRELGTQGLPPASWSFRLMTEQERSDNELKDADEYGVVATGTWSSLDLKVTGTGTVRLGDMFGGMYSWQGRQKTLNPKSKWWKNDPPRGRSWLWVAEKRAQRAALQRVRGYTIADPAQRIEAARAIGLQIEAPEGAVFNADQAQAAVNLATVDAARKSVEDDMRRLLGEEAYEEFLIKRLKENQARMYGTKDPFSDEEQALIEAPEQDSDPEQDLMEGFFGDDAELEDLPADTDILLAVSDAYDELISKNPALTRPASEAQVKLWVQRLREALETTDDPIMAASLVTARLCNISDPEDVLDPEFVPEDAQVRAWMRAWLIPAKPYDLSPEGQRQIEIIYTEAMRAYMADEFDELADEPSGPEE